MRLIGVDQRGQPRWAGSEAAQKPPAFGPAGRRRGPSAQASPEEGEWSIETWRAGKIAYALCVAMATGILVAHALS